MNLRSKRRQEVRLDMTPLIDVVFLLLIFFMVSTTFDRQTRLKVDLPEAVTQANKEEDKDKIAIVIDAKGQFYVNEQELLKHDLDTLVRTMQKLAGENLEMPVIVTGDKHAPYQSSITVMDAASQLGLSRLSFVAEQAPSGE